ncbi:MAG: cytochrome c [bacterium]|nr:cytochrome c [bacterium]
MKTAVRILLYTVAGIIVLVTGVLGYVRFGLPNVGDAPNWTAKSSPEILERGEYLTHHVVGCIDCHSERDWTKFSGPVIDGTWGKGGEVFDAKYGLPGSFTAKNITPYHLRSWSDGELFRTITSGVSKDGSPLFPIMPYDNFNHLDPEDVNAIIAYVRTLPAIANDPPPSQVKFPMSLIERLIPMKYNSPTRPPETDRVSYGKYLATVSSCVFCHTPIVKGKPNELMKFGGGMEFQMPKGGTVRAANISPDNLSGIGLWTEEQFLAKFKQYQHRDSLATVLPGEFNSIMPWNVYAGMKEEDIRAIWSYLRTVPAVNHKVEKFTP